MYWSIPSPLKKPPSYHSKKKYYASKLSDIETTQPFIRNEIPYRCVVLVSMGVFSGYAAMVSLQAKLKSELGISQSGPDASLFTFAVSTQYIGNLIFRIAHNALFVCFTPAQRVTIAMLAMFAAMSIIVFGVFWMQNHHIGLVFAAYGLAGVSVGSFESNLISAITPLGKTTKVWAIIGLPVGFNVITIGGFAIMSFGVPVVTLYVYVLLSLIVGFVVFNFYIPMDQPTHRQASFTESIKAWREWFPAIVPNCIALMFDMFFVSLASAINLYIYNDQDVVPLFGPLDSDTLMNHDLFFAMMNTLTFLGDSCSRQFAYLIRQDLRQGMVLFAFVLCCFAGGALLTFKVAILAPIGMFLIFWANGGIYGSSTRFIDANIPSRHNLAALSIWLFIGDFGSITGANSVDLIRNYICNNEVFPFMCLDSN